MGWGGGGLRGGAQKIVVRPAHITSTSERGSLTAAGADPGLSNWGGQRFLILSSLLRAVQTQITSKFRSPVVTNDLSIPVRLPGQLHTNTRYCFQFNSIQFNIYFVQLFSKNKQENCLVHTKCIKTTNNMKSSIDNRNYTNINIM